jgi:UDP-N-acetylmuramate dehydrogenase
MVLMTTTPPLEALRAHFGAQLQEKVPLAPYTAARVGGLADVLITVDSTAGLVHAAHHLWKANLSFFLLGGGSNILISDAGVREVVLLNRARKVVFQQDLEPPQVWAESGANFGSLARQAAGKGLGGLAWAAGIPGTLGGAVFGNAGAHGRDMTDNLGMAEILHHIRGREEWDLRALNYSYRSSALKGQIDQVVILSATLRLENQPDELIREEMEENLRFRRRTQPPGASMGSMFKNPPNDYAGRLLEVAGLKGSEIGGARISSKHANFFINDGQASAADIFALIQKARQAVVKEFGIKLALEVELVGDWSGYELQ